MFDEWNIIRLKENEDGKNINMEILLGGEYGENDEIVNDSIVQFLMSETDLENVFLTFVVDGVRVMVPTINI